MVVVNAPDFNSLSEATLFDQVILSTSFRANVLILCDGVSVDSVVDELSLVQGAEWHRCRLPGTLQLPRAGDGTVLLYDVSQLTLIQQIALSDWLALGRGQARVISISQVSLFERVQDGRFLEGLYYRLNTVTMRASHQTGWRR